MPQLLRRDGPRLHRLARAAVAAAAFAAPLCTPVHGQDSLPTAAQILVRYHAAVGGEAFAAIQSLHSVGSIAVPAAGLTGTLEIWQGRPNRTFIVANVPGFGEVRTGFNGENGWSLDPADGPRVLAGPEAAQAEDDAHFDSHLRPAELVASMQAIERTTLSGYDCYKVLTVWKSGRETTDCFSTENGLLVGSLRMHQGSTGPAEALVLYEEYREIGGARIPTRVTTQVSGIEQVITLHTIELNTVPDSAFLPPPEIRALLGS